MYSTAHTKSPVRITNTVLSFPSTVLGVAEGSYSIMYPMLDRVTLIIIPIGRSFKEPPKISFLHLLSEAAPW